MSKYQLNQHRQQGLTLITWVIIMGILGLLVVVTLRLFPIYTNAFKIKGILESLTEEPRIYEMDRNSVLKVVDKRININMVDGFDHEYFTITLKDNGNKIFRIKYEDRRPLMANLDAVAKFDYSVTITRTGAIIGDD